jgi:tetratricopeptide (TPR) repeat protein
LAKHLGDRSFLWLQQRLQDGLWQSAADEEEVARAIDAAPDGMASAAIGEIVQCVLPTLSAKAYEKALVYDENIFDAWLGLGILHHLAGRKAEARRNYERATAIRDDWMPLCSNYGQLLAIEFGEYAEAEKWLRKASNLAPRDQTIANNLALCLWFQHQKDKAEEAIAQFKRVDALRLNELKQDPQLWINIGNIYELELEDYPSAEMAYRRAVSMTKRSAKARVFLADLLLHRMHDVDGALTQYQKSCAEDTTASAGWIGLGNLLAGIRHDFKGAEEAYVTATTKDEPARAWSVLGEMRMKQPDQYKEAEAAFREAIRVDPENCLGWHGLGWVYSIYLHQPDEARKYFAKAVECSPKNASCLNSLGNIEFDHFNQLEAAEAHFKKALEFAPKEDLARHNYAFLLRDFRGDIAGARTLLASLRQPEQWQDTQALHETLFGAYEQNWGHAQEALRKALTLIRGNGFPRNTQDDWYRASAVLLHLGYGQMLLDFLKVEGQDECRMPWFEALQAHVIGDRQYLLNIPAEAQEVAGTIYDQIARRRAFLPKHTLKK